MGTGHKYTQNERNFFIEFVPGHSHREIQSEFTSRFGWPISLSQIKGYIANHKLNTGRNGQFVKGQVSHNKGKKMPPEVYEKVKVSMFNPGSIPENTLPVGTEQMESDGYIWVKIDNKPKVRKDQNWKQKHRIIWEEHYGPIPKNNVVIFADRDHNNFDLDNLIMITRSELLVMNRKGFITNNKEITKSGLLIAKVINKISEIERV